MKIYHAEYTPLQRLDLWMKATKTTRFTVAHYWGIHHSQVTKWFREGKFPESRLAQLEALIKLAPEDAPRVRCRLTAVVEKLPHVEARASRTVFRPSASVVNYQQSRLF